MSAPAPSPAGGIDAETVRKVGRLSRIRLSDADVTLFTAQLAKILDHVAELNKLDTTGVEPMVHAVPLHDVLREDVPHVPLTPAEALAGAPARDGDYFRVPKVLGDGGGA